MSPDELEVALREETERVEWKESERDSGKVCKAVCALANDLGNTRRPGILVLGLANDGRPVGVATRGATMDQIVTGLVSSLSSGRIVPVPSINVEWTTQQGKSLILISVEPYPVPPIVRFDGEAFVRRGPATYRATEADTLRLQERRPLNALPYDARPCPGATLDDIDLNLLQPRYENERSSDEDIDSFPPLDRWLTQRDLGRPIEGVWTPNATCVLVYGKSPQSFFPGARIEFVRYQGHEVDAPVLFRKPIAGPLPDQLQAVWTQIASSVVEVPVADVGIRSAFVPEYPVEALKEIARNMIQHRLYEGTNAPSRVEWFDDRVVFSNPGGPFGRASEGEFGSHSDYRNPMVTSELVELGYVQRLGRGVRVMRIALERNRNPALGVEVDGFTTLTVRRRP